MRKLVFLLTFLSGYMATFAQEIHGYIHDEYHQALQGASVRDSNSNVVSLTDVNGYFTIQSKLPTTLIIANVGFQSDTIQVSNNAEKLHIDLMGGVELSEVVVLERAPGVINDRNAIQVAQLITGEELCKAACCNLSESFETNASVDVSFSDAVSGAKQIKLLGLSGKYVQMLSENVPTVRGLASTYGLGYTPGPWMESIQVSKGTSSVTNGYEALTGQINFEYLKPTKSDLIAANVFVSDAGRYETNVNSAIKINKHLSTGLLLHTENENTEWDMNKDGFVDQPLVNQYNIANRWNYQTANYTSQVFLRYLHEDRNGGQMSDIPNPYKIEILTDRAEIFMKNGYVLDKKKNRSIALILSASHHVQNSMFGLTDYDASQTNYYANLLYQTDFSKIHKITTGLSVNADLYDETLNANQFNTNETVSGAFAEYALNYKKKLMVLAGLRADYSSVYGAFFTPRMHVKYIPSKKLNIRASAGKGYRTPNILAENSYLFTSNRSINIDPNLKQEEAWNYGLNAITYFKLFHREVSLQGEWFYTNFIQQAVTDIDSNPHQVNIGNLNGISFANSMQIELNAEIYRGWTITLAHRINDTKTTINGELREKPLTNRYKSIITTSYQTKLKKWQFDFTTQFNGGGRLPDAATVNPLWEKEFKAYTILNAQITKYFKTWSVYLGSENLTNFTQMHPIINPQSPFGSDFDASMVWGPMHGRKIYLGLRWGINKN